MKSLPTILVSSIAFSGAAAEPLLECPDLVTDKTPDWRFEASAAKGGETFNPLEGWYRSHHAGALHGRKKELNRHASSNTETSAP